jgi:hypothetical protein
MRRPTRRFAVCRLAPADVPPPTLARVLDRITLRRLRKESAPEPAMRSRSRADGRHPGLGGRGGAARQRRAVGHTASGHPRSAISNTSSDTRPVLSPSRRELAGTQLRNKISGRAELRRGRCGRRSRRASGRRTSRTGDSGRTPTCASARSAPRLPRGGIRIRKDAGGTRSQAGDRSMGDGSNSVQASSPT